MRPAQSLNQPHDEGNQKSKNHKRRQENGHNPEATSDGSDVARDVGLRVATQVAAYHRDISSNRHCFVEANITRDCGDIAGNLPLIFDEDAASKSGDVARHLPSNANAASNAGDICHFFIRANAYVMAPRRAIWITRGKRGGRHSKT